MADTDDINDLYEAARKATLRSIISTPGGEATRGYAEAYALLTENPPTKPKPPKPRVGTVH